MSKIYKTTGFKILDIKQGGIVIPKRCDTHEVSPSPTFYLESAFTLCGTGRRYLRGDWHASRVKELELRSGETKMDRVLQIRIPEKRHFCTEKDLQWIPLEYSREY